MAKDDFEGQEVGLSLIAHILESHKETKVVAISRLIFPESVYRLLLCGVSFLRKSNLDTQDEVRNLVDAVRMGRIIYSSAIVPQLRQACKEAPRGQFDEVDIRILKLVLRGETDKAIGEKVHLGEDAIGARLSEMKKPFGFKGPNSRFLLANWVRGYLAPVLGIRWDDA